MTDARHSLRAATSDLHQRVDAAFAAFDLACPAAYGRVLAAHARVAVPVERELRRRTLWSAWSSRAPLLLADIAELGRSIPPAMAVERFSAAGSWGAQYVMEGSRLGGRLLARRIGLGLPRRYLSAPAADAGWPRFQAELQAQLQAATDRGDEGWVEAAVGAARRVFLAFERAAALELGAARGL